MILPPNCTGIPPRVAALTRARATLGLRGGFTGRGSASALSCKPTREVVHFQQRGPSQGFLPRAMIAESERCASCHAVRASAERAYRSQHWSWRRCCAVSYSRRQ
jgi:hypothetical protein